MLKNIVPRRPVEEIIRTIEFDRGDGSGLSFDADENCNPEYWEEDVYE